MFPLDLDVNASKAMVSYRQEQVRASFPRKITRWLSPEPRRDVPVVSATATPRLAVDGLAVDGLAVEGLAEHRLAEHSVAEPRRVQQEEKYVA